MDKRITFGGESYTYVVPFGLVGNYNCRLDDKGRLKLPSELLDQLGHENDTTFVLNKGFRNNLDLYPVKTWEDYTKRLHAVPDYSEDVMNFRLEFYRDASRVVKDGAGRLLLNKELLDRYGIDRDVKLICIGDIIGIWKVESIEQIKMQEQAYSKTYMEVFSGQYKSQTP
ncbi:MAG: division/cell wall cluster transcriptional repressor MraZ [Saprospiraceae bacterium]|nr:division/cell wall cluster transcriptional repressor MraZ [Saprospiraceae bacterium]